MKRTRLSAAELVKLRLALELMEPRDVLHRVVKEEMQKRGRWKTKPRGRPGWPGFDTRRNREDQIK